VIWIFFLLAFTSASFAYAADESAPAPLSFEQRVACVEKVEDVYWAHRIWPEHNPGAKPPRAAIVSSRQVAEYVETSLLYEAALENVWGEVLAPNQIQVEMERIARDTQYPELLLDVYAALNNDPNLVAECFVRPRLVEGILRDRFSKDSEIHAETRLDAESATLARSSTVELEARGGSISEVIWRRDDPDFQAKKGTVEAGNELVLSPREFDELVAEVERGFGDLDALVGSGFSPPLEDDHGYYSIAVEAADDHSIHVSSARWAKQTMDLWFDDVRSGLQPIEPQGAEYTLPETKTKSQCIDNTWEATSTTGAPANHSFNVTVWTGAEMIVWGGGDWPGINTGGRYDLAADTWTATSTTGAPSPRMQLAGVWTGIEMIVWGGVHYPDYLNTGGRYNPATNTWTVTSTTGAPEERSDHVAVWTGTEMIAWGGNGSSSYLASGGRYNPVSNTWSATSMTDAPLGRRPNTVVWSGTEMIIWGGSGGGAIFDTGGRYSPVADTWAATSTTDVPVARRDHIAVWTGAEMIVWGGYIGSGPALENTGGRYDPATDSWAATSTGGVPSGRYMHTGVWAGTEMIIWGGKDFATGQVDTGGRYDPAGDTWTATSTTDTPVGREIHSTAWAGPTPKMIVWGGWDNSGPLTTGGLYCVSGLIPYDFGDAPDPTYPTLEASDGARHRLGSLIYLGADVDADDDGQPTANADGDDTGDRDDEDGVTFTSVANPGGTALVDVAASESCLLNAWVDFNADGDWSDAGEQVFTDEALAAGVNALGFAVPATASVGVSTAARFRASSAGGLSPGGSAGDGEVEDYMITIEELDFGDAPDPTYPSLLASNGARHIIGGPLFLGATVDADPDGQPSTYANGDDNDAQGDDEDGISFITWLVAGQTCTIRVTASSAGVVNAWIDFNADGDWSDAGEQIFTDVAVVAGANNLDYSIPLTAATDVDTFARFRLNSTGGLSFGGLAVDGEVEDHHVMIAALDYGDAPDPTYPTLQASDGARHIIVSGFHLGASVDLEGDGQPTAAADGDDTSGADDEDGVVFTSGIGRGLNASLEVTASATGLLSAWIDFNADGDWNDAGEQVFTDLNLAAGVNPLSLQVPITAALGSTYARFRFSLTTGLYPNGYATHGEVEDYLVEIVEGPDLQIDMTASTEPAPSGRPLTYSITVTNNGPLSASSVTVTDTLPGEVVFVSSTPGGPDCTFAVDTLTCDLGTMAPTDTAAITIDAVLDHPVYGAFDNTATVTAAELDPILTNNAATAHTVIGIFVDGLESGDTTGWD